MSTSKSPVMKWAGFLAVFAAIVAIGYGLAWRFLPLEMSELSNRWAYWKAGVQEVRAYGLDGYLRDHCAPQKECACMVLIHGLGDNATTWKRLVLASKTSWSKSMKIYAFDLPGTGDSEPPATPDGYRARKLAARLKTTLEPLCPKWTVVGNSLGGWIAGWIAIDWPAGVSNLVLVNSGGLKQEQEKSAVSALGQPTVESMKDFQRRAYHQPREIPEHIWEAIVARARKSSNASQVISAQIADDYLMPHLSSIRVPTLVFWGASDQIVSPENGRKFHELIPGSSYREIPACGHLPQKECPQPLIEAINGH